MPELPEVETIRRQLAPLVAGSTLRDVQVLDPRWSDPLLPEALAEVLEGRQVERLERRGKYLVWVLDGELFLVQHLRMSGTLLYEPTVDPPHARVRIELVGGDSGEGARRTLVISDPRRFGTAQLIGGQAELDAFFASRLGIEPFDEGFTASYLRFHTRHRRAPIKAVLLDQRVIAGVGNIYADEALFRARIHPSRPARLLSAAECDRLRAGVLEALEAGIDARGASIDAFRDVEGVRGSFQDRLLVHRRAGEPCPRCGRTIVKCVVAGRGTYVCAHCQPRPRRPRR
jgi:formamidopyrimidine-DNA glycosylase